MLTQKSQSVILAALFVLVFMALGAAAPAGAVTTHYRSIGTHWGSLYETGLATISAGSVTVDLSSGARLPANVGRGDRLRIGHEIFYILDKPSGTQLTVQRPARHNHFQQPYSIRRAYHSIQAWESRRDGNLVRDDRLEVGLCYNDGPFHSRWRYALATINGSRTDAEHFMWLRAAAGQRHVGIAGTGVVLDGRGRTMFGIRVRDDYTRVQGLEMKRFRRYHGAAAVQVRGARHVLLEGLLIHDFYSRRYSVVGIEGSRRSDFTVRNCIIYSGDTAAIRTNRRSGTARIENCTVYGMHGRGIYEDRGILTVTNTIAMANRRGDFSVSRGDQAHNLSSDVSAAGSASITGLDPDGQFVSIETGKENFHLAAEAAAVDAGINLAPEFAKDIDENPRPAGPAWDIGADETAVMPAARKNTVWYVDLEKSGDGTSWQNAFATIQQAVEAAAPQEEIWVKTGRYLLSAPITITHPVNLYGGFAGTETRREERNRPMYPTVISGTSGVRCFSIQADDARIDGFTIAGAYIYENGGGIYAANAANLNIAHCRFENNWAIKGGGIYTQATSGAVTDSLFVGNTAGVSGGGIYALNSRLDIVNGVFAANAAGGEGPTGGGAIYNAASDSIITNCSFAANAARYGNPGGAIYNQGSYPVITNCIFWNNVAENSPAIYDDFQSAAEVIYSDISQPEYHNGVGNIAADPVWADAPNHDLHLQPGSACINAGLNTAEAIAETDFEGDARIMGGAVDMGADEFNPGL